MALLNKTTIDARLLATPQWIVDTNSFMLPSVGKHGVWRHALPIELQKALEEDRFSELFLYDMQQRLDLLSAAFSQKTQSGELVLATHQDAEIGKRIRELTKARADFRQQYGGCTQVDRLYRTQLDILYNVLENGVEYEPCDRYWEIRKKAMSLTSDMDKKPNAIWHNDANMTRPKGMDFNIISEWLCHNLEEVPTALVTLDRSLEKVARRNAEIIGDWKPEGIGNGNIWFSIYYSSRSQFYREMKKSGFVFEPKPDYARK